LRPALPDPLRTTHRENQSTLKPEEPVKRNLDFLEDERNIGVLNELICICLVQSPQYLTTYDQLVNDVLEFEERVLEDAADADYVSTSIPREPYRLYLPVLPDAWEKDESLNAPEKHILDALRAQLRLSRRHHRLIESKIGRFPQNNNKLHSARQIDEALRHLQMKGLLLRFKSDHEYFVIPEEMASIVRYESGAESNGEA